MFSSSVASLFLVSPSDKADVCRDLRRNVFFHRQMENWSTSIMISRKKRLLDSFDNQNVYARLHPICSLIEILFLTSFTWKMPMVLCVHSSSLIVCCTRAEANRNGAHLHAQ